MSGWQCIGLGDIKIEAVCIFKADTLYIKLPYSFLLMPLLKAQLLKQLNKSLCIFCNYLRVECGDFHVCCSLQKILYSGQEDEPVNTPCNQSKAYHECDCESADCRINK